MCGIAGYIGTRPASDVVTGVLESLTYRGYDSCGIATLDSGRIQVVRKVGAIDEGQPISLPGSIGIGHTRWATHGPVCERNAHPHIDCHGKLAVVHNGTLDNYAVLRAGLEKKGHIFRSDTDTEVVAHLLEEMTLEQAARILEGTYALLVIYESGRMEAAVNKCPLIIARSPDGIVVASDECALPAGPRRRLKDGEIVEITGDMDLPESSTTSAPQAPDRGDYPHFMLKEIYEQPRTILRTIVPLSDPLLMRTAIDLLRADSIVFTASGTSRYATLVGRYVLSNVMHRLGEVIVSSEFQYFSGSMRRGMAVIAVSQSGETADIIQGAGQAKTRGAQIIAITNNPSSVLGRMADMIIPLNCGSEIAVAASKTFSSELAVFYLLAGTIAGRTDAVRQELVIVADAVSKVLADQKDRIRGVARRISGCSDMYYIGRGINFAVAGESALKMKEISYIHAEGMSAGELKHGTLSLVTPDTPVCGICPEDYTYQETVLNLTEVKSRGGWVVGISDLASPVFDEWIQIPKVPEVYYPVVCAVVAQLMAYWTAVEKGLNPDRPRNLAKSVTVR